MKHYSFKDLRQWPAERLSTMVLYVLVAVAAAVFALFYLVGFDTPYADDPQFNAPLFTDVVLGLLFLSLLLGCVAAGFSLIHAWKLRDKISRTVNNIPARRITAYTFGGVVACLAVTFLMGSSAPVVVNGTSYSNVFWLKATDMFVNTSLVLIIVAAAGVVLGLSGYGRKLKLKNKEL